MRMFEIALQDFAVAKKAETDRLKSLSHKAGLVSRNLFNELNRITQAANQLLNSSGVPVRMVIGKGSRAGKPGQVGTFCQITFLRFEDNRPDREMDKVFFMLEDNQKVSLSSASTKTSEFEIEQLLSEEILEGIVANCLRNVLAINITALAD